MALTTNRGQKLVRNRRNNFTAKQKKSYSISLKSLNGLTYGEAEKVLWELFNTIKESSKITFS